MKFVETLASYLPSLIVHHLLDHDPIANPPGRQSYNTVCMFADVSGFTALSEAMSVFGVGGAEYLAKHLNAYFGQMVRIIASEGGDIFKFAGDAMIVLWPDMDSVDVRCRRAAQCALAIQHSLHAAALEKGVTLSVKIGIGVGKISVLHLGGALKRMEYVAVGEPLVQAFAAEHCATAGGEVIMSPQAWARVKEYFEPMEVLAHGNVRLASCKKLVRKVNIARMLKELSLDSVGIEVEGRLRSYVPGAIIPWVNPDSPDQESWGADLRNVTVLFVNLGLKDHDLLAAAQYDDAMKRSHDVLLAVQTAVYQFEGSVNKFLMDDKGSTLIAVFGLPPLSHEDDATRGVLAALAICSRLWDLGLSASVGITTGVVFCGVVGSTTRKEYTVLGDTVNLSARLMQRVCSEGGGVLCDQQIRQSASQGIEFQELGTINVKGKTEAIRIYRPMPRSIPWPVVNTPGSEPRVFRQAFEHQLDNVYSHGLLRPYHVRPPPQKDTTAFSPSVTDGTASPTTAPATGAGGAAGGENRRTSKLASIVSGPTERSSSVTQLKLGEVEKPPVYSQKRMCHLMVRAMAPFSAATLPTVSECQVYVAPDLIHPDALTRSIDYGAQIELSKKIPCDEAATPTLRDLRDAAVAAARADSRIPATIPTDEFLLMITGSKFIVPDLKLPIIWLAVFSLEVDAVDNRLVGGLLKVDLVKRRDQFSRQSRHTRVRQRLLERKMELIALKRGSTVLVEGDFGMGKSEMLMEFVQNVMPSKTSVFCANGNPFTRSQPYAAWADLLKLFLKKYQDFKSLPSTTAAVTQLLEEHCDDDELSALGYLLNPMLQLSLPTGQRSIKGKVRDRAIRALMFVLLRGMASKFPVILIIDDGHLLHKSSWDFALQIAAAASVPPESPDSLQLMLVIGTRPIKFYLDVVAPTEPPGYTALREASFVDILRLTRLPVRESEALVRSCCRWRGEVHPSVFKLVEDKAHGNPLMIKEVVITLAGKGRLVAEGVVLPGAAGRSSIGGAGSSASRRGLLRLADDFDPDTQFPFCKRVMANLGTRVDRLTPVQQMILKVGSMISLEFKYSLMHGSFPLEPYKDMLLRECDGLADMRYLHSSIAPAPAGQGTDPEVVYRFSTGFLADAVKFRMLAQQRTKIAEAYKACSDEHDAHLRRIYLWKMIDKDDPTSPTSSLGSKSSWLFARKNIGVSRARAFRSDWKKRWVTVDTSTIKQYKEEVVKDSGRAVDPVQVIPLKGCKVEEVPEDELGRPFVFRIDAISWEKKGTLVEEPRSFYLQAESAEHLSEWKFLIELLAERLTLMEKKANPSAVRGDSLSEIDSGEQRSKDDTSLEPFKKRLNGNQVIVSVCSARNLPPAKYQGPTNPFVSVVLDSVSRTSSVIRNSQSPAWGPKDILMLPVTLDQAAAGVLKFFVWDEDDYGADELLGIAMLPLTSLEPQMFSAEEPDETSSAQAAQEPVTLQLWSPEETSECYLDATQPATDGSAGGASGFSGRAKKRGARKPGLYLGELVVRMRLLLTGSSMEELPARRSTLAASLVSSRALTSSRPAIQALASCSRSDLDWLFGSALLGPRLAWGDDPPEGGASGEGRSGDVSASPSPRASIRNARRRRASGLSISDSAGPDNSAVLNAIEKLENSLSLLRSLSRRGSGSESHPSSEPSAGAGGASPAALSDSALEPLRSEVMQALKFLRGSQRRGTLSSTDSTSFLQMVSLCDLDDTHKRWLSTEYTREVEESTPATGGPSQTTTPSADGDATATKAETTPLGASGSAGGPLKPLEVLASDADLAATSLNEIGALHTKLLAAPATPGYYGWGVDVMRIWTDPPGVEDKFENLFYEDTEGGLQGPFSGAQMYEWYKQDYMPLDMAVRLGNTEGSPSVLLEALLPALRVQSHVSAIQDVIVGEEGPQPWRDVLSWEFDIWRVEFDTPEDLLPMVTYMIVALRVPAVFHLDQDQCLGFVEAVRDHMGLFGNPYHNFFHAVDVMHAVFLFLHTMDAGRLFTPVEEFAVAIAALCHDLEHPGFNNQYQINAQTELAIKFNDQSVLENHHAVVASQLLRDNHVLAGFNTEQFKEFRRVLIMTILATDMTCHFGLTEELKSCGLRNSDTISALLSGTPLPVGDEVPSELSKNDRNVILKTLLHAADISNPCKPWTISKNWSDRVIEEFFAQGDREKAEGLPISPNMDRDTTKQSQLSVNFIDFIVAPLFVALTALIPKTQVCCDTLFANRATWSEMVHDELDRVDPSPLQEQSKRNFKRRTTAFKEVLMPMVTAAREGVDEDEGEDAKLKKLHALHTFVSAHRTTDADSD